MASASAIANTLVFSGFAAAATISQTLTHTEKDSATLESVIRDAESEAVLSTYGVDTTGRPLNNQITITELFASWDEEAGRSSSPESSSDETFAGEITDESPPERNAQNDTEECFRGLSVVRISHVPGAVELTVAYSNPTNDPYSIFVYGTTNVLSQWQMVDPDSWRIFSTNVTMRLPWGNHPVGFFFPAWYMDSDQDGICDSDEIVLYSTDPRKADTDGDGLSDGTEVRWSHTNPLDPDTDGDGMNDGWEYRNDGNPLEWNDPTVDEDHDGLTALEESLLGTCPYLEDSDFDSLPDGWEVANGLNPTSAVGDHGRTGDPDWDGISNYMEYLNGTHPRIPDPDNLSEADDPAWVNAQVGVAQTNGYYKFVASFPTAPATNTVLRVGNRRVLISAAGEYSFLMEKGLRYEFGTAPYCANVTYSVCDDLSDEGISQFGNGRAIGDWSISGGERNISNPTEENLLGFVELFPVFQASPNVGTFYHEDFPLRFSAQLEDCPHPERVAYNWRVNGEGFTYQVIAGNVLIVNADSNTGLLSIQAEAVYEGRTFISGLRERSWADEVSQVSFRLTAPELVFLNDDDRTSRWYRVGVELSAPYPTNALVRLTHSGSTNPRYSEDLEPIELQVTTPGGEASHDLYFACSSIGSGAFTARCEFENGEVRIDEKEYRVIEPLQRLITFETTPDGEHIYNPSRIVTDEETYLKVSANGPLREGDVQWRVVSGSASIRDVDPLTACVVTSRRRGQVVVEAAFGHDAAIQPRFVLPIVEKRIIPVKAFVVEGQEECPIVDADSIAEMIEYANKHFSQIGIEFELLGEIEAIPDSSYLTLAEHDIGRTTRSASAQCISLFGYGNNYVIDVVKVFFVSEIINGTSLGFSVKDRNSIVLSTLGAENYSNVAHELGHIVGLDDIYDITKGLVRYVIRDADSSPTYEMFGDRLRDWTADDGRGFLPRDASRRSVLKSLVMYGYDDRRGCDIPSGSIKGLPSKFGDSESFLAVGADQTGE